jgi:hypothetical protein
VGKFLGLKLQIDKLKGLNLQRGFKPLSETLSNQEYPHLWDVLFDHHPKGPYYKGKFEQSGNLVPAKSLLHRSGRGGTREMQYSTPYQSGRPQGRASRTRAT